MPFTMGINAAKYYKNEGQMITYSESNCNTLLNKI